MFAHMSSGHCCVCRARRGEINRKWRGCNPPEVFFSFTLISVHSELLSFHCYFIFYDNISPAFWLVYTTS